MKSLECFSPLLKFSASSFDGNGNVRKGDFLARKCAFFVQMKEKHLRELLFNSLMEIQIIHDTSMFPNEHSGFAATEGERGSV